MCKANEYIQKLNSLYEEIIKEHNIVSDQLSTVDRYEQDILHIIERGNFNASQGYKLAKMIYDNRQIRREIKIERDTLANLKTNFVDISYGTLKKVNLSVKTQNDTLTTLSENKCYTPKILESTDINTVTQKEFKSSTTKLTSKKELKNKKTGEPITILNKVDNDLYYCKYKNGNKNLLKRSGILNIDLYEQGLL